MTPRSVGCWSLPARPDCTSSTRMRLVSLSRLQRAARISTNRRRRCGSQLRALRSPPQGARHGGGSSPQRERLACRAGGEFQTRWAGCRRPHDDVVLLHGWPFSTGVAPTLARGTLDHVPETIARRSSTTNPRSSRSQPAQPEPESARAGRRGPREGPSLAGLRGARRSSSQLRWSLVALLPGRRGRRSRVAQTLRGQSSEWRGRCPIQLPLRRPTVP